MHPPAHLMPLEADGQVGTRAAAELEAQLPGALHQGNLQQGLCLMLTALDSTLQPLLLSRCTQAATANTIDTTTSSMVTSSVCHR